MVTSLSREPEVLPKMPVLQGASTGESRPIQPKDCNLLPRAQREKQVPAHVAQAFHAGLGFVSRSPGGELSLEHFWKNFSK